MTDHILRRPEVERITGLSRSTLYSWISAGRFPRPVALGARLVGWRASDIAQWLAERETKAG
jgi:prophage regulatory protein